MKNLRKTDQEAVRFKSTEEIQQEERNRNEMPPDPE